MMTRAFRRTVAAVALAACSEGRQPTTPPAPMRLVLADSVEHLDALTREPMVVRHPSGALFVSGYWDPVPPLYRSTDGGATWARVGLGTEAEGAAGNSDLDLAVAPDGTLYLATLVFDRQRYAGKSIHVAVSHDVGQSWRWTRLSATPFVDRPWVDVAPDGTAHVIWNDGAGVPHAMSTDGGRSWTAGGRANPAGGSSHLAVGPGGEVAVRFVPMSASGNRFDPGVDGIAVSRDRGLTWARHPPPATLAWFPLFDTTVTPPRPTLPAQPRWVEPLAWDATGALYSLWAADSTVWLGRSTDLGATWTRWKIADTEALPYYPYLIARGRGDLAASWITGKGASLRANLARIAVSPDTTPPTVAMAAPFAFESFMLPGFGLPADRDAGGEYLPLVFLDDDSVGIVTPIQNPGAGRMGFAWRRYRAVR